jgi:hypothetical protein
MINEDLKGKGREVARSPSLRLVAEGEGEDASAASRCSRLELERLLRHGRGSIPSPIDWTRNRVERGAIHREKGTGRQKWAGEEAGDDEWEDDPDPEPKVERPKREITRTAIPGWEHRVEKYDTLIVQDLWVVLPRGCPGGGN